MRVDGWEERGEKVLRGFGERRGLLEEKEVVGGGGEEVGGGGGGVLGGGGGGCWGGEGGGCWGRGGVGGGGGVLGGKRNQVAR